MYCSSCGVAVTQDLSYCKRCGAKLGDANSDNARLSPVALVGAMVSVLIIGFGAVIALMAMTKGADPFNEAFIKAIAVLSFLLMLAAEGVFSWLLLRQNKGAAKAGAPPQMKAQTTAEIGAAPERLLVEPAPGVTEHTTRTLETAYSERKTR
jgi:hypothetical protein